MAYTPKIKRRWVKEEKRLVYLMYRAGLLATFPKIEELYWKEYHSLKKTYKSKNVNGDGRRYKFSIYMPEIHYCTTNYWGESDEHSIVDHVWQGLYWTHIDEANYDPTSFEYPNSLAPKMTRLQFIKYLKTLSVKVEDKKIKKVLKIRPNE